MPLPFASHGNRYGERFKAVAARHATGGRDEARDRGNDGAAPKDKQRQRQCG